MTLTAPASVSLNVGCSAVHPLAPRPFHGRAIFDADGITIRGLWGGLRAAYPWSAVASLRMVVSHERVGLTLADGVSVGLWLGWMMAWWELFQVPDVTRAPGGGTGTVRLTGTLELVTADGYWHLRVFHRAPYQVVKVLRPYVRL